jgi:hypothetical protein
LTVRQVVVQRNAVVRSIDARHDVVAVSGRSGSLRCGWCRPSTHPFHRLVRSGLRPESQLYFSSTSQTFGKSIMSAKSSGRPRHRRATACDTSRSSTRRNRLARPRGAPAPRGAMAQGPPPDSCRATRHHLLATSGATVLGGSRNYPPHPISCQIGTNCVHRT